MTALAAITMVGLSLATKRVHPLNPGLVLLILTLLVSAKFGFRAGLVAALVSNAVVIFFFLPPLFQFWADDPQELASLPLFLLASAIGSSLLETYKVLADQARKGQAQAEALLQLNRAIIGQTDPHDTLHELSDHLVKTFAARGASVVMKEGDQWTVLTSSGPPDSARGVSSGDAASVAAAMSTGSVQHVQRGGSSAAVAASDAANAHGEPSNVIFVPLSVGERRIGALRVDGPLGATPFKKDPEELMKAYAGEASLAIGRIELARAIRDAETLRQADAMKTAILNSISHDLRTPLATIKAATSSLLDPDVAWTGGDRTAFLSSIEMESDRLDRTIRELLDLNRLQANALRPMVKLVPLIDIVDNAVESCGKSLSNRNVKVDVPDILVTTDATLLSRALANLLENAAVHSRADGGISLTAALSEAQTRIRIEDEGPGIDAAELPHIFTPFYKAKSAVGPTSGSGLGLAIVEGFIALCGGRVEAESSDSYTRFIVTLPGPVEPASEDL